MLKLNRSKLDIKARVLKYTLPVPFGPNYKSAYFNVTAKPSTTLNSEYTKAVETLHARAKLMDCVREKAYRSDDNDEAYVQSGSDDSQATGLELMSIKYDHCIVKWETNIQNNGKDMKPTKNNFMELLEVPDPDLVKMFTKFSKDLDDMGKWQASALAELEKEEVGNSKAS